MAVRPKRREPQGAPAKQGWYVVCGPPASGKTTWVNAHRKAGDAVWDFDEVVRVVFGEGRIVLDEGRRAVLMAMCDAFVSSLARLPRGCGVYLIVTASEWAHDLARRIGANVIAMDTPKDECVARLRARDRENAHRDDMERVVAAWR